MPHLGGGPSVASLDGGAIVAGSLRAGVAYAAPARGPGLRGRT
jgi:hypothetical protein